MERGGATRAELEPGSGLGIVAILSGVGGAFFVLAVFTAFSSQWGTAVAAFGMGVVAAVAASGYYAFYARFRSDASHIHALTAKRDEALRRVGELRQYADFCEAEAKCWPKDSLDRDELVVYAKVATRQAEETLHKWREIERALRATRFEQIVGPRE